MKFRTDLLERSEKVKALFEPSSADYKISRTFDSSPETYQLNSITLKYQENIRKLWELTREHCRPLAASKTTVPGPGSYNPPKSYERQGFSFSRDMRVFDK